MRVRIAGALEALWLAVAFAVPLTFNPWGYNAFELPKALLLRAVVLLMGLLLLARAMETRERPERRPSPRLVRAMLWPALALGLAYALATLLSVNPRASLLGSYLRQQGLFTLAAYLALFLITAANLRRPAQVERLWTTLVWGSAPVVAYGLIQATGLDPVDWRSDAASPVLSTVGRANFLGSYLVLLIPLTARQILLVRRRWPYALLLAGQLVCLALTQARGAWIGLGAAAVVGLLAWAVASGDRRPIWAALGLSALAVGFVLVLNLRGGPLAPLAQVPGFDRLATLTRADAGSTAARLTIWRATLPLVAAHPWLGHGPETMEPVFARVFPPQLVYYQGRHVLVDRAHNLWLDLAMSTGLAGLVAHFALLIGFGSLAWRGLRSATDRWRRTTWAALAASTLGHVVDLQFGFELTASATVFWLLLALGAALARDEAPSPVRPVHAGSRRTERRAALSGAAAPYLPPAVAVLALIGLICVRPLLADVAYRTCQRSGRAPVDRVEAAARAVRRWPLEPVYRLGLARARGQRGDFAAAETQLDAADRLSPDDPRIWAARAELYAQWGATEPERYVQAERAYRRTLELAPNVAVYHTGLGLVLARRGNLDAAAAELERAVALDATDGVAFGHLARLYRALGHDEKADWARARAVR